LSCRSFEQKVVQPEQYRALQTIQISHSTRNSSRERRADPTAHPASVASRLILPLFLAPAEPRCSAVQPACETPSTCMIGVRVPSSLEGAGALERATVAAPVNVRAPPRGISTTSGFGRDLLLDQARGEQRRPDLVVGGLHRVAGLSAVGSPADPAQGSPMVGSRTRQDVFHGSRLMAPELKPRPYIRRQWEGRP